MSMGHWESGKAAGQLLSSNLARKGFVVLAYDPVGQGERQQAYEARVGRSLVGGATEQHFTNGAAAILMGHSVGRYFIHDGMRAIDYLVSRPEVLCRCHSPPDAAALRQKLFGGLRCDPPERRESGRGGIVDGSAAGGM